MPVHLSEIMPSIFSSLGLSTAHDSIGCGESPSGREVLFLIDGFGAGALWLSAALGGFCFVALMLLPGPSTNKQATAGR
mgnify:CR=1 FL=1